jgi:hypothetical protein
LLDIVAKNVEFTYYSVFLFDHLFMAEIVCFVYENGKYIFSINGGYRDMVITFKTDDLSYVPIKVISIDELEKLQTEKYWHLFKMVPTDFKEQEEDR